MSQFTNYLHKVYARSQKLLTALPARSRGRAKALLHGEHPAALAPVGVMAGTLVATPRGWQPVDMLTRGDEVITFDHGIQPIRGNQLIRFAADALDAAAAMIHIPAGALGNRQEMAVLPEQEVLLESDAAEALFGDPFVLVPARTLEHHVGIRRVPLEQGLTLSVLSFAREEIIYCNGGLLCLGRAADTVAQPACYPRLTSAQLRMLIKAKRQEHEPRPAFAGQSVEETYAALDSRLA